MFSLFLLYNIEIFICPSDLVCRSELASESASMLHVWYHFFAEYPQYVPASHLEATSWDNLSGFGPFSIMSCIWVCLKMGYIPNEIAI